MLRDPETKKFSVFLDLLAIATLELENLCEFETELKNIRVKVGGSYWVDTRKK